MTKQNTLIKFITFMILFSGSLLSIEKIDEKSN
jgi:hypothetical protein